MCRYLSKKRKRNNFICEVYLSLIFTNHFFFFIIAQIFFFSCLFQYFGTLEFEVFNKLFGTIFFSFIFKELEVLIFRINFAK